MILIAALLVKEVLNFIERFVKDAFNNWYAFTLNSTSLLASSVYFMYCYRD